MQNNNKGAQKDYKGKGEKLQCKITAKKLKTIKRDKTTAKRSDISLKRDTTKNVAKANNEKKWIKTKSGTKQIQRKNSYKKGD